MNNRGDSDYDDENDSHIEDDGGSVSDRSQLNNAGLHGDGRNMFDDLEKSTLLDKTQQNIVQNIGVPQIKGKLF